jgi:hypothetical protein
MSVGAAKWVGIGRLMRLWIDTPRLGKLRDGFLLSGKL